MTATRKTLLTAVALLLIASLSAFANSYTISSASTALRFNDLNIGAPTCGTSVGTMVGITPDPSWSTIPGTIWASCANTGFGSAGAPVDTRVNFFFDLTIPPDEVLYQAFLTVEFPLAASVYYFSPGGLKTWPQYLTSGVPLTIAGSFHGSGNPIVLLVSQPLGGLFGIDYKLTYNTLAAPEPASTGLAGAGLLLVGLFRRRK